MTNIKIIFVHLIYVSRNYLNRKIYYKNNEKEMILTIF